MAYLGENKADSIMSDIWPNHYYSNKNDYRHLLLKKLELHLRDLNNQIKELTFENIKRDCGWKCWGALPTTMLSNNKPQYF